MSSIFNVHHYLPISSLYNVKDYLPSSLPSVPYLEYFWPSSGSSSLIKERPGKLLAISVITVCCGVSISKLLRYLSMCGNSKNPLLRSMHDVLKKYLNCGFMVRSEFYTQISWQCLWIRRGSYVITNYGSYGTVPRKVLQYQISLQMIKMKTWRGHSKREMELCPDYFYRNNLLSKYTESRNCVAKFVGCQPENLVFVDNITDGINCTLRSILKDFDDDDIVLHTNLVYSAVLKAINVYTKEYKVKKLEFLVEFPIVSEEQLCKAYEEFIKDNPKIKVAIFDHISSASAVRFPIEKFAKICRDHNIMSIVDGAHAPGQLHLNIESYGVDVYIGNLHKWYYTPKSCAIMYINPAYHEKMQPSLVSHNYYQNLHSRFWRQGTKNYSAHITAGYAVGDYMESLGGIDHLHSYIPQLVEWAVKLYTSEWNTEEISIPKTMKAPYMRVVYLPEIFTKVYGSQTEDADRMIIDMLNDYNIVMFVNPVNGRLGTRVSAQIFSTKSQYYYAAEVIKNLASVLENKFEANHKLHL